jgi:hypothetical protein
MAHTRRRYHNELECRRTVSPHQKSRIGAEITPHTGYEKPIKMADLLAL